MNPFATAAETAAAVRNKTISARELVELTFQRIDALNPALNAIVGDLRAPALSRAAEADKALTEGRVLGPLHGVPITIKESFAYRGTPNTWGLPDLAHAVSPRTAVAIERLESAGAIVVGKTNVPVMLGDWQSYNPLYGTTNNPWDLSRTSGGSTGGGAAALAAGLGALSMGSDLSGSLRIPAHFCGVYTHKPSLNVIEMDGLQPGPWDGSPGPPMDLAVIGPMSRDARDLALALEVLAGPAGDARKAWTWRMPAPRHTRLQDFRIGYIVDDPIAPISSEVRKPYENLISALTKAGATLKRGWPSGIDLRAAAETYRLPAHVICHCGPDWQEALLVRPCTLAARDAVASRVSHALAEVLRKLRRVSAAGVVHRCVSARSQRADRQARREDSRGPATVRAELVVPGSPLPHSRVCPRRSHQSDSQTRACLLVCRSSRRCGRTGRQSSSLHFCQK